MNCSINHLSVCDDLGIRGSLEYLLINEAEVRSDFLQSGKWGSDESFYINWKPGEYQGDPTFKHCYLNTLSIYSTDAVHFL